jgi:hypothetical protein
MSNKPVSVQKNLADYLLKIFPQLKFLKRTIVTSKLEKATGDQPSLKLRLAKQATGCRGNLWWRWGWV